MPRGVWRANLRVPRRHSHKTMYASIKPLRWQLKMVLWFWTWGTTWPKCRRCWNKPRKRRRNNATLFLTWSRILRIWMNSCSRWATRSKVKAPRCPTWSRKKTNFQKIWIRVKWRRMKCKQKSIYLRRRTRTTYWISKPRMRL